MRVSDEERKDVKNNVIGTQRLTYGEIEKDEIDLLLEAIDSVIDGSDLDITPKGILERFENMSSNRKLLYGNIIITGDPKVKEDIAIEYEWTDESEENQAQYKMK